MFRVANILVLLGLAACVPHGQAGFHSPFAARPPAPQLSAADQEAAAWCQYQGAAAGASGGFAASVVGEARTRAACLDYYQQTGRLPGR